MLSAQQQQGIIIVGYALTSNTQRANDFRHYSSESHRVLTSQILPSLLVSKSLASIRVFICFFHFEKYKNSINKMTTRAPLLEIHICQFLTEGRMLLTSPCLLLTVSSYEVVQRPRSFPIVYLQVNQGKLVDFEHFQLKMSLILNLILIKATKRMASLLS